MGISVFPQPAAGSKTRFATTLNSGTSYTVPAGVNYLNVKTIGGGGGGGCSKGGNPSIQAGTPGQVVESTVNTSPGATINYSIGAGGAGGILNYPSAPGGGSGGTTTFTGATSASGGDGGSGQTGGQVTTSRQGLGAANSGGGGGGGGSNGGDGGSGQIIIEYWA